MYNIKLRLSLSVPGAQMLSKQECFKNPKKSYDINKMSVRYEVGEGKKRKIKTDILVIKTRKPRLVRHNINICTEAYEYMLSVPPSQTQKYMKLVKTKKGKRVPLWETMDTDSRLRSHLDLIASDFNAAGYTYEVLDD